MTQAKEKTPPFIQLVTEMVPLSGEAWTAKHKEMWTLYPKKMKKLKMKTPEEIREVS